MSNDSDLFFKACRAGSPMVHTLLVGRCVTEKRKGVLICYENGHGDLADTVLKTFQHSQIAACMDELLAHPHRFQNPEDVCNRMYKISNYQLCMRSMAVHNYWRCFEFLIKHKHLPDPRQTPSVPTRLSDDARAAARCGSLEVLDVLTPNRTVDCVKSLLRSTLEVDQFSTIPHLCEKLPEELFSLAMQNSYRYRNMNLIRFLIHSMQNRENTTLLLSVLLTTCLRNNWDEPVHEYAKEYPHTLKDILAQMETMGDDKAAQFVPFLSYYEKYLLNQNINENQSVTRSNRKL